MGVTSRAAATRRIVRAPRPSSSTSASAASTIRRRLRGSRAGLLSTSESIHRGAWAVDLFVRSGTVVLPLSSLTGDLKRGYVGPSVDAVHRVYVDSRATGRNGQ